MPAPTCVPSLARLLLPSFLLCLPLPLVCGPLLPPPLGTSSEAPGQQQAPGLGPEGEGTHGSGESGFCGQGTGGWRWAPALGAAVGWHVCQCVLRMWVRDRVCPGGACEQDVEFVRVDEGWGPGPPWALGGGIRLLPGRAHLILPFLLSPLTQQGALSLIRSFLPYPTPCPQTSG